ncbi:MAG: hypothetical protein H0W76_16300 [Pyrinomonadaceae bacterium]|nr:hypothetical protein [Pyrinomonadaceae bacterium]
MKKLLARSIYVFLAATTICASAAVTFTQHTDSEKRDKKQLNEMGASSAEPWLELSSQRNSREQWEKLNSRGQRFYDLGDYERARAAHHTAMAVARARNDVVAVAESQHQLGRVIKGQGKVIIYLTQDRQLTAACCSSLLKNDEVSDQPLASSR